MTFIEWQHLLSDILLRRQTALPFKYFLVVTKACRSRCSHCSIWKQRPSNEMSLMEYRLLAKHSHSNLIWLNISGGEPTDRDDLVDIIETFRENCPKLQIINFTSNGMRPDKLSEIASYLSSVDIPLKGINISIDGPPAVHDKIRGMPGSFDSAIESLQILKAYKNIRSTAAYTLLPANQMFVDETAALIRERIPEFEEQDLHLNYPHASAHYYGTDILDVQKNLQEHLKSFRHKNKLSFKPALIMERIYQVNLSEYQRTGKTPLPCAALSGNVYISEKGDIYPCTIWDKKIGSLRENNYDLERVLSGASAKASREDIIEKRCPNCWTPCEAFPSILTDKWKALRSLL